MHRLSRKGGSRPCQSNAATAASKKEIDERRLRKLKVYLRSVSYNGCEGVPKFPTLPDLYEDTILSEEFPCDTMKLTSRHHCAPTPFLIACCFNRRYPVNARKRAGTIRSKPSIKQNIEKINSPSTEKKSFATTGNTVSSGVGQTSKTTNIQDQASTSVGVMKLHAASAVEQGKTEKKDESTKTVDQDKCAVNEKNNDKQSSKVCKNTSNVNVEITTENIELEKEKCNTEISIPTIKGKHSGGKTGNCETHMKDARSYATSEGETSESETSEVDKLKTKKVMLEKTERMGNTIENKEHSLEVKREVCNDLEHCLTKEESRPANKGSNEGICSGTCSALNDNSSCHTSFVQIKPEDSTFEDQKVKDKTGDISHTSTSPKAKIIRDDDQTSVCQKVENEKVSAEKTVSTARRQQNEDDIMSNISADLSRRNSPRLGTLCNRHKTVTALQDKDKSVQRRNAKFVEKMKLKVSENANTRLRSRAVIKQPGHENHYTKAHHARGK